MFCRGPCLRSRLLRTGERPVNGHKYATVMRQDFMGDVRTSQHLLSNRVSLSAPEKEVIVIDDYLEGLGVMQDYTRALDYFQQVHAAGDAQASVEALDSILGSALCFMAHQVK